MPILTLPAKVLADPESERVLLDAMMCATKVYNGLLWHLREEFKHTGKTQVTRHGLNAILKTLPRAKGYYALSVQATRDEVIQAYRSFFGLRKAGRAQHQMPGFRRKGVYSPLRYFDGYGFRLEGDRLTLSLGTERSDGVRQVTVTLQMGRDVLIRRVRNVLLTYDAQSGLRAHLVAEVEAKEPLGHRKVAVDLGETQAITAVLDDGTALMYSGRLIKSVRRYWQKIRAKVKPPTVENPRKSRRYRQIEGKESRQVHHLLHLLTTDFVRRCWEAGVDTIAMGDLTAIRELMNYGPALNQRLHVWPYGKMVKMIEYKAGLYGMAVIRINESYSSQMCHGCGEIRKRNRVFRGWYRCDCGWQTHADVNGAANLFLAAYQVSPVAERRSSGEVATPVVVPIRLGWHTVHEPTSPAA